MTTRATSIMSALTDFPRWIQGWANPWYWDRNQIPVDAFKHIRDIGFPAVQFVIDVSAVVTGPFKYQWEMRADKDMRVFEDLGFKVILKPMWAHRCQTEGLPSNVEGVYGCWTKDPSDRRGWREAVNCGWTEDGIVHLAGTSPHPGACGRTEDDPRHDVPLELLDSMDSHPFQPEKPYCMPGNVPHRDVDMERHLGAALAARYGNLTRNGKRIVIGYTRENEPDIRAYNPSMCEPWHLAYDRYVREVWKPFIEGVRSVVSDALFVGPEAASPGAIRFFHEAAVRAGLRLGGEGGINWLPSGHMYAQGGVPFPQGTFNEIEREGGWRANMKRAGYETMVNSEIGAGHNIVIDDKETHGQLVEGLRALRDRHPWIISHSTHSYADWFEGGQKAWDEGRFVRNQLSRDMEKLIKGDVALPPPPEPRVLTERAYRIVDMARLETRDRVYVSPTYLFVAVRQPAIDTAHGPALNVEWTFRGDEYVIVPISNDALVPGDQRFELWIQHCNETWLSSTMWSELPPVTVAELGLDENGRKRRGMRS